MKSTLLSGIGSKTAIHVLGSAILLSSLASAGTPPASGAAILSTSGVRSIEDDSRAPAPVVIRATGAIASEVDVFRALLGNPNNGATPGQQPAGRREINWDGVPALVTNVLDFPKEFFNTNSPRGLVYGPASRGLDVSNQSFVEINRAYAGEFLPFSGTKVFSPVGTNETEIRFRVAGTNTEALVSGFGVVFVDVDRIGSTAIELVGENGLKLGRYTAPARSDRRGASFLGVAFRDPVIKSVHIVSGDGALSADEIDVSHGGRHDLVVMDDFLYGEPTAIRQ